MAGNVLHFVPHNIQFIYLYSIYIYIYVYIVYTACTNIYRYMYICIIIIHCHAAVAIFESIIFGRGFASKKQNNYLHLIEILGSPRFLLREMSCFRQIRSLKDPTHLDVFNCGPKGTWWCRNLPIFSLSLPPHPKLGLLS